MNEIDTIEREEYGLIARIGYDEAGSDNPRDWDNCWTILTNERGSIPIDETIDPDYCTMVCERCEGTGEEPGTASGPNYVSCTGPCKGDGTYIDIDAWLKDTHDAHLIVPVFKYEHGLVQYKAGKNGNPFNDRWDSGQVGVAVISKATIEHEWGTEGRRDREFDPETKTYTEIGEPLSPEDWALRYLDGELSTYTSWCNGEVYYYEVETEDGEYIDSCGGFYDEDFWKGENGSYVYAEAIEALDHAQEKIEEERAEARYWRDRGVETVG